jgi:hypothetical protein
LKMNFAVKEVFALKRKKNLAMIDVLSYIGGMLGLLSGFSFISIIELVYIFVLKPILSLKCLRSNKVGPKTEVQPKRKKNFIAEYLANSSIHSFYYFVNEKRFLEK